MTGALSVIGWLVLVLITGWAWVIGAGALVWSINGGGNAKGETAAIVVVASFLAWLCWYSSPLSIVVKVAS